MIKNNREIKVTINTLTPLWTGDAWGENYKIRPSSIMGSLRFWFELICYFSGIIDNRDYEEGKLKDNLNSDEFKKKLLIYGSSFEGLYKALAKCKISLPSKVFGCKGWKGWIRIKRIKVKNKENCKYPIGKVEFEELKYTKKYFDKKENKEKEKEVIPTYYFSKGFCGKFAITFEIEEKILEPIFYPVLRFIEKYGFLGGKWNIGYGRVKVENVDDALWNSKFANKDDNEIEFKFSKSNFKKINELINIKNGFSSSTASSEFLKFFLDVDSFDCFGEKKFQKKIFNLSHNKIQIAILNDDFFNFQTAIKKLLKIKSKIRNCLRHEGEVYIKIKDCFEDKKFFPDKILTYKNKEKIKCNELKLWIDFRHKLLGTTSGGSEGSKIIPWIYEENAKIKGGFVSIAEILNMEGR